MTGDDIRVTCRVIAEADPGAMVVHSPGSYEAGGHVTVVHERGMADVVDAAIAGAGLVGDRIDATRVKVRSE